MNTTVEMPWISYDYVVTPVSTWSLYQMFLFPVLFVVPTEVLALICDSILWYCGMGLPLLPLEKYPALEWKDWSYVWFNRLCVLPLISFLIVRAVWNADCIIWDMDKMNIWNVIVAFVVVFSLSDLTYYTGHRIVHKVPALYNFIHKHHHGESHPRRGWVDTCNAHPTDFFYTGFCTAPCSVLWLLPVGTVHIVAVIISMHAVMFVGALGHSRIDINVWVFNSRFHAGHHALTKCNYAQNIELWDRLFGTYRELPMSGKEARPALDAKPQPFEVKILPKDSKVNPTKSKHS
jgi:sterol desaturase/sphingolipid hydroxylase (fatty acid hydroxylase superfamily)